MAFSNDNLIENCCKIFKLNCTELEKSKIYCFKIGVSDRDFSKIPGTQ